MEKYLFGAARVRCCNDYHVIVSKLRCSVFRVQDADKLDAIGAFGVLRCAAFSGAKNRPLYVPDQVAIENISQKDYLDESNKNNSAITHFHGM